jgi:hypothetical protein
MKNDSPPPLSRITLALALASLLFVNLAVFAHFSGFGSRFLIFGLLGTALAAGIATWIRLRKPSS